MTSIPTVTASRTGPISNQAGNQSETSAPVQTIDKSHSTLHLHLLPSPFSLFQLKPADPLPDGILASLAGISVESEAGRYVSVTRTRGEVSIVVECYSSNDEKEEGKDEGKWRCITIVGPQSLGALLRVPRA